MSNNKTSVGEIILGIVGLGIIAGLIWLLVKITQEIIKFIQGIIAIINFLSSGTPACLITWGAIAFCVFLIIYLRALYNLDREQKLKQWKARKEEEIEVARLEQQHEAAKKAHQARLEAEAKAKEEHRQKMTPVIDLAETQGFDVCRVCMTIEPNRCQYDKCNCCISGCNASNGKYCKTCQAINQCGDPYCDGNCAICDDDDDYDDDDGDDYYDYHDY